MKNVYLSALRLVNLGPWGDETVEFSEGLNVIVGPNGAGKSALFSSVRIALLGNRMTADDRRDAIHKGCMSAQIYFLFSDNSVYRVTITEKDVIYFYCDDIVNDKDFKHVQPNDLEDLKLKLGSLVQGDLICNMIEMDKEKFLIDTKDSDNYGVISFIINDEDLDNLITSVRDYRLPAIKTLVGNISRDMNTYQTLMSEFEKVDVTSMKAKWNNANNLLTGLDYLIQAEEMLGSVSEFRSFPKRSQELVGVASSLEDAIDDFSRVMEFKEFPNHSEGNLGLAESLEEIIINLTTLTEVKDYSKEVEALNLVNSLDLTLFDDLQRVNLSEEKVSTLLQSLNDLEGIIEDLNTILSYGDVQTNLDYYKEQLDEEVGEIYDNCPIYGKIKFANGECVPCDQ